MTEAARPARNVVARAGLASVAFVVAAVPGAVLVGANFPDLPIVGRLGAYVTTDLPALLFWAVVALGLVRVARRLGGGRFTLFLTGVITGIVIAVVLVGVALWVTAKASGATYSPFRQIIPLEVPAAGSRVDIATVDGTTLHAMLWGPAFIPESTPAPGPALVFIHGGGFTSGGLDSRPWLFEAVRSAGFAVIDIEYRLAPPARWRDAPADVLCALAWVNEHAARYAIDPARVVIGGDSAGGNLALVAGYSVGSPIRGLAGSQINSSCGGTPVVPAGVIAIEPAADLAGIWQDLSAAGDPLPFPEAYLGGTPAQLPGQYQDASPFGWIHAGVPPTLIVTGADDHLVRLERVQALADALERDGARYKLIVIPFADHGLDAMPRSAGSQLLEVLLPQFVRDPAAIIVR